MDYVTYGNRKRSVHIDVPVKTGKGYSPKIFSPNLNTKKLQSFVKIEENRNADKVSRTPRNMQLVIQPNMVGGEETSKQYGNLQDATYHGQSPYSRINTNKSALYQPHSAKDEMEMLNRIDEVPSHWSKPPVSVQQKVNKIKNMNKDVNKMGGLGGDIGSHDWSMRKEKLERMIQYGKSNKMLNKMIIYNQEPRTDVDSNSLERYEPDNSYQFGNRRMSSNLQKNGASIVKNRLGKIKDRGLEMDSVTGDSYAKPPRPGKQRKQNEDSSQNEDANDYMQKSNSAMSS